MKKNIKKFASMILILSMMSSLGAITVTAVSPPSISGNVAAIVMDFDSGEVLFEHNAHLRRAPASMTKALTTFVVYEQIAAGYFDMDTIVTVSANAARVSAIHDTRDGLFFLRPLQAGSQHSVETLLFLTMGPSSNGATVALAEHVSGSVSEFAELMNETGRNIGMYADFHNAHGVEPNMTTAYSMATLLRTFIYRHPDILRITSATTYNFGGRDLVNTNLLLPGRTHFYEGADGFRTGTGGGGGHNLSATAVRDGQRIITVVMNAANDGGRYGYTHRILDFGFAEAARRDAERPLTISLNGEYIELDIAPQMINSNPMVPLRAMFEALGWNVNWVTETSTAILTNEAGDEVRLAAGNRTIYINHTPHSLDIPSQIIDERMFVSTELLSLALTQLDIYWDAAARTIVIDGTHATDYIGNAYITASTEELEYNDNEYSDGDSIEDDTDEYNDEYYGENN